MTVGDMVLDRKRLSGPGTPCLCATSLRDADSQHRAVSGQGWAIVPLGWDFGAADGEIGQLRSDSDAVGEVRLVHLNCMATLGQVGNVDHENIVIGKAGRNRHRGRRPTVRGSVMNPRDHPHGGGEGKAPIGGQPKTKWGKPVQARTRNNKRTDSMIVRRRTTKRK